MGLIANLLRKRFSPPTTVKSLGEKLYFFNIEVDFVIEAGAHEGSDTLLLSNLSGVKNIYCFEPNPYSFDILQSKISKASKQNIKVFNVGLLDKNTEAKLFFPKIDLGGFQEKHAGTSSIHKNWAKSDGEHVAVKLVKLDEFLMSSPDFKSLTNDSSGLLWLDVEGAALQALKGMSQILRQIDVAKIEVEYGIQQGQWDDKNLFKIIQYMRQLYFIPVSGYLHPLTRGDLLFIKINKLKLTDRLRSIAYLILIYLFYGIIYPARTWLKSIS